MIILSVAFQNIFKIYPQCTGTILGKSWQRTTLW